MIRKALKSAPSLHGPTPEEMTLMTADTTSSSTITTPPSQNEHPSATLTPKQVRELVASTQLSRDALASMRSVLRVHVG
jgi:hypothetical protein